MIERWGIMRPNGHVVKSSKQWALALQGDFPNLTVMHTVNGSWTEFESVHRDSGRS